MGGQPRVERKAIGPRRGLKEAAAASIRRLACLAGIAIRAMTVSVATQGKEARPTRQALMMAKPPSVVGGRMALAPEVRPTL